MGCGLKTYLDAPWRVRLVSTAPMTIVWLPAIWLPGFRASRYFLVASRSPIDRIGRSAMNVLALHKWLRLSQRRRRVIARTEISSNRCEAFDGGLLRTAVSRRGKEGRAEATGAPMPSDTLCMAFPRSPRTSRWFRVYLTSARWRGCLLRPAISQDWVLRSGV